MRSPQSDPTGRQMVHTSVMTIKNLRVNGGAAIDVRVTPKVAAAPVKTSLKPGATIGARPFLVKQNG